MKAPVKRAAIESARQKKTPHVCHDIEIRKIPFDYSARIAPVWHAEQPEWSHMVNGASLTMPYLEPFLIKNIREALAQIDDEQLLADARGFIGQEAQHYKNHQRYNDMLKASGYAELAQVEAYMKADYERLSLRSLAWRLAYTAGFETMTMGLTEWLINERAELFQGADPVVTSLVLWHMVEETEHKSVAFDVYQAVCGNYWLRVFGLVYGSFHLGFLARRGYRLMLQRDGQWRSLRSRLQLWRMVGRFFRKVGPAMLRGLLPGHHPDETTDPEWVRRWGQAFSKLADNQLPLLNTTSSIEPEFVAVGVSTG